MEEEGINEDNVKEEMMKHIWARTRNVEIRPTSGSPAGSISQQASLVYFLFPNPASMFNKIKSVSVSFRFRHETRNKNAAGIETIKQIIDIDN